MHQTVANTILITNISNSQPQQVLSWHLHTPGSHQSSLLNRSESVSQSVTDKGKQWSDSGPIKRKKGCKQISFSHKTLCLPLPTLQKAPPAWEGCTWPGEDRHRDIFETHKYFLLCANVIKEKYLLDIYKLFFITHKCILFSVLNCKSIRGQVCYPRKSYQNIKIKDIDRGENLCSSVNFFIEIETSRETSISFQSLGRNMAGSSWSFCYPYVGRSDTGEFIARSFRHYVLVTSTGKNIFGLGDGTFCTKMKKKRIRYMQLCML